jgi:hypothetical protein
MKWTDHEITILRSFYGESASGPIALRSAAKLLGRDKANVCRKARELGLTNPRRAKQLQPTLVNLGKHTPEELKAHQSRGMRERIATRGHPRGFLGEKHTPESRAIMSLKCRAAWADPKHRFNSPELAQEKSDRMVGLIAEGKMRGGYNRSAGGRREDLGGTYFRSSWEANYARVLEWYRSKGRIRSWAYEAKTFIFDAIKRGTRAYTPDFRVEGLSGCVEWHEVKGWMDPKSATRLRRMAKYYPAERVRVIDEAWFRNARQSGLSAVIPGWEHNGRGARGA